MSVHRNRAPRTAALFLSLALGGGALTMTPAAEAAPVAPAIISHQAARAATATEQTVTRLSLAKASAGDTILVHGTKLATYASSAWTAKAVKFGETTVTSSDVTALSARVLQVKVPAQPTGTVTVLVGDATKGPKFTYVAKVTTGQTALTALKPTSEAGLAGQTITGDHFSKATKVLVGGKGVKLDKTTPVSEDGKTIKFDYPAGLVGVQDVVVTDNGESYYLGYVTYTATKITVTDLDYDTAFVEAPTTLKVTGTELDNVSSVVFTHGDASEKVAFKADKTDDKKATVTVPKGAAFEGQLEFSTKWGETASIDLDRVAAAKPTLSEVTTVAAAGGEATLTGTNLRGLKTVTIYSTTPTVKKYTPKVVEVAADGKTAKITVPALPNNAKYQVEVATLFATPSDKLDFTVGTVAAAATVTSASASSDAKTITINGTNLTGATKVKFGSGAEITSGITVDSATKVTVVLSSALAAGTYDVVVTTAAGASTGGTGKLVVAAASSAPTVSAASASSDAKTITITGANLTGATKVKFGSGADITTGITVDSATKVTVVLSSALDAGTYDVVVTTAGGASTGGNGKLVVAAAPAPTLTEAGYDEGTGSDPSYLTINGANIVVGTKVRYTPSGGSAVVVAVTGGNATDGYSVELSGPLAVGDYQVEVSADGTNWSTSQTVTVAAPEPPVDPGTDG